MPASALSVCLSWTSDILMVLDDAVPRPAALGSGLAACAAPSPAVAPNPLVTCQVYGTLHSRNDLPAPQTGCAAEARTIAGVEQRESSSAVPPPVHRRSPAHELQHCTSTRLLFGLPRAGQAAPTH
jgi:hypothetical protein